MNEIQAVAPTGRTLYAEVISTVGDATTGHVWQSGNTFAAVTNSSLIAQTIALTEQGATGIYLGSFPATITTPGTYLVLVYSRAGGSPAIGDALVGSGSLDWTGAALAGVGPAQNSAATLITRIPGTVQPQTGDAFARLGAPSGASVSADIAGVPESVLARSLGHGMTVGQLLVLLQSGEASGVSNSWNASTHTLTTTYQFAGDDGPLRTDATVYPDTQITAPPVQSRTTTTGTIPQP